MSQRKVKHDDDDDYYPSHRDHSAEEDQPQLYVKKPKRTSQPNNITSPQQQDAHSSDGAITINPNSGTAKKKAPKVKQKDQRKKYKEDEEKKELRKLKMAKYMQTMGYGEEDDLEGMDEEALASYMGKPAEELSYQEAMQELIALTNDLGKVTGVGGKKKKRQKGSDDDDDDSDEYDQEEGEEEGEEEMEEDQYGMQMDSDQDFDDDELGEI